MAAAKEKVAEAVEQAVEIVEETVEAVNTPYAWRCGLSRKQHVIQLVGLGVAAGAVGGVAAYYICKKKLETKYEQIAKQEIEDAKKFYARINKADAFSTPEGAANALHVDEGAKALRRYKGESPSEDAAAVTDLNIFAQSHVESHFDLEAEMPNRSEEAPFIITQDEFLEAEPGYEQVTLTYYEGDDTLADEGDQAIPLIDETVGKGTLHRFGHGSGDARTVFVRNDKLSTDFEVVKSDGKYAHEVLGLEHSDEYGNRDRHSRRNQYRKERGGDE